jgi:hypothetical protein
LTPSIRCNAQTLPFELIHQLGHETATIAAALGALDNVNV